MARLGDIFVITSGGTPNRKKNEYYDNGTVPWVKTGDLKEKYVPFEVDCITEEGVKNSSAKRFPIGTVLVAMYGATIGACSILPYEATTNQACAAFLPNESVLSDFLYYFLRSKKEQFIKDGVGGAQPNISASYLRNVEMSIPSFEEQQKIVESLDEVDSLLSLRKQQLAKLDELVKSQFVEMFGQPGDDSKGWGLTTLGKCCVLNPKRPKDIPDDAPVSFVAMPSVSELGEIDTSVIKTYSDVKKGLTYFAEDDVLFAKITPCMENGKGCVAKGLSSGIGVGSTEFHVLRPIAGKSNPYWLYCITIMPGFREAARKNMTGTGGQLRVPVSYLDRQPITLPPISLQEEFERFFLQTDKSKLAVQQSIAQLEILKKSLMQKYFG